MVPATGSDRGWSHMVNVSALEGKFSVGKKGGGHPHTNMAKAALNMMTCTSAQTLAQDHILVNCVRAHTCPVRIYPQRTLLGMRAQVDTGWVTDMAPGGVGAKAETHATHVGPPLDEVGISVHMFVHVSVHMSIHMFVHTSVHISVHILLAHMSIHAPYCIAPHHTGDRTAPHRTVPHRLAPPRTTLHLTAPHRIAPSHTAPHCTAPHRCLHTGM